MSNHSWLTGVRVCSKSGVLVLEEEALIMVFADVVNGFGSGEVSVQSVPATDMPNVRGSRSSCDGAAFGAVGEVTVPLVVDDGDGSLFMRESCIQVPYSPLV